MADLVQIFRESQHLLAAVRPREPRENLARFVGEARYVADFAARAKTKLLRVGVPRELLESLDRRVRVLEGAQVDLHVSKVRKDPRELSLTREAMAMRREVTKIASFAGRRRPEIGRQLRSLVPLVGLNRALSDLRLLADLAFHEQEMFASVGEDGLAWSERLLTMAQELERAIVERRLLQVAQGERVDQRNRAYAWVLEALREIKAATRYLGIARFEDAERDETLFAPDAPSTRRECPAPSESAARTMKQDGSLRARVVHDPGGLGMRSSFGSLDGARRLLRSSHRWPFGRGRGSG